MLHTSLIPACMNAPVPRPSTTRGLQARSTLAWGNAPGSHPPTTRGLKARAKRLIPHKPLIKCHTILHIHRPHLPLEIPPLMMLGLPIDIPHQRGPIAQAHRERRIPALPTEPRKLRPLGLNPFRRRHLQPLHHTRHRLRPRQKHRHMHMVGHTARAHANVLRTIQNRRQIRMHLRAYAVVQQWPSILRTKHNVHQHIRERLRHRPHHRSDPQPSPSLKLRTWGAPPQRAKIARRGPRFAPGYYSVAPMALGTCADPTIHNPRKLADPLRPPSCSTPS